MQSVLIIRHVCYCQVYSFCELRKIRHIHCVPIKMGIFHSTKSSMLKTTHFAAGFSDDSTTKVILRRQRKLSHEVCATTLSVGPVWLLLSNHQKTGRKMCSFEHQRFCGGKNSHFYLDTVYYLHEHIFLSLEFFLPRPLRVNIPSAVLM